MPRTFLLERRDEEGGGVRSVGLFYCFNTLCIYKIHFHLQKGVIDTLRSNSSFLIIHILCISTGMHSIVVVFCSNPSLFRQYLELNIFRRSDLAAWMLDEAESGNIQVTEKTFIKGTGSRDRLQIF